MNDQQKIINTTAQFLTRVQLSGSEVPAFTEVMRWLEGLSREAAAPKAEAPSEE
jgi:hypothetical protein